MITAAPLGTPGNTTVLFPCSLNEKGRILTLQSSQGVVLLRPWDRKGPHDADLSVGPKERLSSPTCGVKCLPLA